jgi:hypothetical protein
MEGAFAPIIEGCPYDFDSDKVKEGNDDSDDEDDSRSDEEEEKNTPKALVCCDIFRCNKFVHERCYIKACNIVDGEYYNDDPPDDFQQVYFCPDCDGTYQRWKDLGGMETFMRNSGCSFSASDNDTYIDNTTMDNNDDSDDDDGGGKQRAVETKLKPAAGSKSKWEIDDLYNDDYQPYHPGVNSSEDGSSSSSFRGGNDSSDDSSDDGSDDSSRCRICQEGVQAGWRCVEFKRQEEQSSSICAEDSEGQPRP